MPAPVGVIADSYNAPTGGGPTLPVMSGLVGWYDASDIALADGAAVNSWNDKSGQFRHLATVSVAPILKTNIQNGKSVIRMDGTSNQSLLASAGGTVQHVFVVAKYASNTFSDYSGLITNNTTDIVYIGSQGGTDWYSPGGTNYKNGALSVVGPCLEWAYYSQERSTYASPFMTLIGHDRGISTRYWNGDIGEVLLYDRILNTAERQQIEAYLANKWTPPPTNPFTVVPWHAAFWADDTSWTPPADGGSVTTWRDGSGNSRTMTTTAGTPIYRAAASALNNKKAIEFNGTAVMTAGGTFGTPVPYPQTIVAVVKANKTTPDHWIASGATSSTWDVSAGIQSSNWTTRTNNPLLGPAADLTKHMVEMCVIDTSFSSVTIDGATTKTGGLGNLGENVLGPWRIGEGLFATKGDYIISFVGFKAGELTFQERSSMLAWSRSFYGTP